MFGEASRPSYCTGYHSRALLPSNTGSTALRLAEVQQPKTVATWSWEMSFCAFSANVSQSEAPSSITGWICLPRTPPLALISSIASSVASRTVTSLIAMVPLSECKIPTGMTSASSAVELSAQPVTASTAMTATAVRHRRRPRGIRHPSLGVAGKFRIGRPALVDVPTVGTARCDRRNLLMSYALSNAHSRGPPGVSRRGSARQQRRQQVVEPVGVQRVQCPLDAQALDLLAQIRGFFPQLTFAPARWLGHGLPHISEVVAQVLGGVGSHRALAQQLRHGLLQVGEHPLQPASDRGR